MRQIARPKKITGKKLSKVIFPRKRVINQHGSRNKLRRRRKRNVHKDKPRSPPSKRPRQALGILDSQASVGSTLFGTPPYTPSQQLDCRSLPQMGLSQCSTMTLTPPARGMLSPSLTCAWDMENIPSSGRVRKSPPTPTHEAPIETAWALFQRLHASISGALAAMTGRAALDPHEMQFVFESLAVSKRRADRLSKCFHSYLRP